GIPAGGLTPRTIHRCRSKESEPVRPPQIGRRQILAVAGISVTGALAACSGQDTGTKHLRLSSWNIPVDLESYQAIADRFVEDHPGTSVAVEVTTGSFHQWFITRLAADLAPDIIRITPQQIGRYAANGSLLDLSQAIPEIGRAACRERDS